MRAAVRRARAVGFGVVLAAAPVSGAWAQGPPRVTDTPIMIGLEGRGVRTFVRVTRRGGLRSGTRRLGDGPPTVTATVIPVAVPWNVTARTQVGVVLPTMRVVSEASSRRVSTGPGDVSVFVKRLLVQVDGRGETFRVAGRLRTKLPTGDEDARPALGSGAVGVSGSVVAAWIRRRVGIYGEVVATTSPFGGREVVPGERFALNVALGYRLLPAVYRTYPQPQLNGYLEATLETRRPADRDAAAVPDTGADRVYLAPGLQWVGGRRWLVEGGVRWPVYERVRGVQLVAGWSVSVGTRVLVF